MLTECKFFQKLAVWWDWIYSFPIPTRPVVVTSLTELFDQVPYTVFWLLVDPFEQACRFSKTRRQLVSNQETPTHTCTRSTYPQILSILYSVLFEVLTTVSRKMTVFWAVVPCYTRLHGATTQKTAIFVILYSFLPPWNEFCFSPFINYRCKNWRWKKALCFLVGIFRQRPVVPSLWELWSLWLINRITSQHVLLNE
jgi:hypothetical protein